MYKIIVVDDEERSITPVLNAVKQKLANVEYHVSFQVFSKKNEIENIKTIPADIIMFDCVMSGADYDFTENQETMFGYNILKAYRSGNKRTKIIFYSGGFDFDDYTSITLTPKDYIEIINELNIFAIINKDINMMAEFIKKAIDQLEPVLVGMEDLMAEYGDQGIFDIQGKQYTSDQLMKELQLGTKVGDEFRKKINAIILNYLMKFKW